ncbi:hypothetical protein ACGF0D_20270 [Kitasatospora sp. NPDC048298]|uniref:hypothetical protein n=1 Tax=Kitasatospora sp. NPDC048298 TaxID=3364049 RepID=UPI0037144C44
MHSDHYAPTTTLPGLLQRGRGQGALIAAEDGPSVAELVYGCIRWDWRWDPTADDRDRYLARLVRDLGLPLAPVVELLPGDEGTRHRATRVLELLALGGSAQARAALPDPAPAPDGPTPHHPAKEACPDRGDAYPPAGPGDERDIPALVAELERCWVARTWCGPAALARDLARFGQRAADAVSLLRRFWLSTPHSSERPAYLEALAAMGAAGMPEVYVESLDDCEPRARLRAVRHAPDRPAVRARLGRLRDDPLEVPEVREAAAARLSGLGRQLFEGARVDA